jgi:hypothetical protein
VVRREDESDGQDGDAVKPPLYYLLVLPALYDAADWCRAKWRRHVTADVPPAIAACEFDCREPSCDRARFATCQTRLAAIAGRPVL